MRVDRSERVEGRSGRAVAAILFAALAVSACSHFDKEPPIADGPGAGKHFTITVQDGDTIYSIARRYDVRTADLIDANDLTDKDRIYAGEVLRIPGARRAPLYAEARVPVPQPKPRYGRGAPVITLASYKPRNDDDTLLDRAQNVIDRLGDSSPDRDVSAYQDSSRDSGTARFVWPVSGRIISPFGASASGERNDGINIAADRGTPIRAAADGVVTYSGNELKGYGNLVLIRHSNGYVSAYANASELLVKRGDTIRRGQVIAHSGQTGNVTSPQLHFEIRKGSTPVDPTKFLGG